MKMECPFCGLNGTGDDGFIGKRVRCPGCQEIFRVNESVVVFPDKRGVNATQSQSADESTLESSASADPGAEEGNRMDLETLLEGVVKCTKCGFALHEKFVEQAENNPVCLVCANHAG